MPHAAGQQPLDRPLSARQSPVRYMYVSIYCIRLFQLPALANSIHAVCGRVE